jgi:hypothetical protein
MAAATESGRPRRPSSTPVLWGSLALFLMLFALLTYELAASTPPPPRPVVVRKVVKRRVVTTLVPSPGATTVNGGGPVVTSSAPEYAAGEAAPVTTGAS